MGWVVLEVFLAFGLAVFIVWWTFPKAKKRKPRVIDAVVPPTSDTEVERRGDKT